MSGWVRRFVLPAQTVSFSRTPIGTVSFSITRSPTSRLLYASRKPLFPTGSIAVHSRLMADVTEETKTVTRLKVWRQRIAEHERSGLSVKDFCKERGLTAWSFYSWRKRLRE